MDIDLARILEEAGQDEEHCATRCDPSNAIEKSNEPVGKLAGGSE